MMKRVEIPAVILAFVLSAMIFLGFKAHSQTGNVFQATSGFIGGGLLTIGCTANQTISVPGARTGNAVVVTPLGEPTGNTNPLAWVSADDSVTMKVCTPLTLTPVALQYGIRVFP